MPTWNTAIVQTSKWPTQEKHFHARLLVSYLLVINNSYNVVAFSSEHILLLYGQNNAAYMGTEIVRTDFQCKWLTHAHWRHCAVYRRVLSLPRVAIGFAQEFAFKKRFAISIYSRHWYSIVAVLLEIREKAIIIRS